MDCVVIQTSSCPASSQKTISILWWSQQLSSNFKPHLHFQNSRKVVASRIQSHLSSNSLSSSFQSAYRIFHSTETTLLKIHNDLILAMDRGEVTSLILLDLSAAFDTVGSVLMVCLLIGSHLISHFALRLSQSMIPSLHSLLFPVVYPKVPYLAHSFSLSIQLLLARWSQKILSISFVRWWHPAVHLFHSYNFCSISWNTYYHFQWHSLLDELEQILLNPSKTEFLVIDTKQQRLKFSDLTNLSLSNDIIPVSSSARKSWLHLWLWHVFLWSNQLCIQSCHFHIRDIRRIRHLLPLSTATALANSLVSSKLDYCNSLYSWHLTNKSQQTSTHSKFIGTCHYKYFKISTHHTIFQKLHWLPIKQRIDYKTCLLTYKTLTNQQPTNLHNSLSFLHILFLHDLLIRLFFPFHMSDHHLAKGLSL